MSDKITVITQPKDRIVVNSPQKTQIKSVNVLGGGGGASALEQLTDVDITLKSNNSTLVYDANSGKYFVRELPILDGGTF